MDIASVLTIVVIVIAVYFFLKLVVSPLVRAVAGIIAFLIILYLLQRIFGFDLSRIFGRYSVFLDISKWGINLNLILNPVNYLIKEILNFLQQGWEKIPKSPQL
ncbi:MAG: hypothetical protein NT026_02590 [Candidatus Staskawiczbacteria bacterium]|nr:hypothetical protein [Candidatus Staskawiczbacteria bacterium]